MTCLGFLVTVSLAFLLTLLLGSLVASVLLVLSPFNLILPPTLCQYILPTSERIKKLLMPRWIALLAHVCFGDILVIRGDSNAHIMLPHATVVACNPSVIVVVPGLDSTANAANDFDLCFLLGRLLRLLRRFLLGLGRLVKEIETLRVLSFRRSDGSPRFIYREGMLAILSKGDGGTPPSGSVAQYGKRCYCLPAMLSN